MNQLSTDLRPEDSPVPSPSAAETSPLRVVPGASYLGRAVNIFDASREMTEHMLFDTSKGTVAINLDGTLMGLPENAICERDAGAMVARFETFADRRTYEEKESAKHGVSANYGGFSASFERTFSRSRESETNHTYALATCSIPRWRLTLIEHSERRLAPWVKENADFIDLPSTFQPEELFRFVRFFEKYGTHFVSEVMLGGELEYAVAVDKKLDSSTVSVETHFRAEYSAVFASAKAESQSKWGSVKKEWLENRKASVSVVGGTTSMLSIVDPVKDDHHGPALQEWEASVSGALGVRGYRVEEICEIFSGDKRDAVREALIHYLTANIRVGSSWRTSRITILGESYLAENPLPTQPNMGKYGELNPDTPQTCCIATLMILQRRSLAPILHKHYAPKAQLETMSEGEKSKFANYQKWAAPMWEEMCSDLMHMRPGEHILSFATRSWRYPACPPPEFTEILLACGASADKLVKWATFAPQQTAEVHHRMSYAFVGIYGMRMGRDSLRLGFEEETSSDYRLAWMYNPVDTEAIGALRADGLGAYQLVFR